MFARQRCRIYKVYGLGGNRQPSFPSSVNHDEIEEPPRPYSGSRAVGASCAIDTGYEEKKEAELEKEPETQPEKRARGPSAIDSLSRQKHSHRL